MKAFVLRGLSLLINLAIFGIAAGLVIIFAIAIDEYVSKNRLSFLRAGNWTDLITISVLGLLLSYVLKKLLVLQWKWKVVR